MMRDWRRLSSLLTLLLVWQVAAALIADPLLPGPAAVLDRMATEAADGTLPHHLGATLARVAVSFVLALSLGGAIGIAMGRSPLVDRLFDGWLSFFLNLPALVTIILAYVWLGLGEAAAILAVAVNKIPNVAVTMREGARTLDPELSAMAAAYRFGRWRSLRDVVLPQLAPYLLASARGGLALIWKIVLVVELLGRSNGVGFQLHIQFQMFDIAGLLAYALAFIFVVQVIELGALVPLEKRCVRWR